LAVLATGKMRQMRHYKKGCLIFIILILQNQGCWDNMKLEAIMANPEQYNPIESNEPREGKIEFTKQELAGIEQKRQTLSSLAHFIGKDFRIPVELNKPGAGWHWDFKENKIRIDPKDLLEKPMDYLRFVISHEGGHRRISRTEFIPLETWKQPGFSFMMNAIEDPRDNNFVAESYPKFVEQMQLAYQEDLDFEKKSQEKARAKLGYAPRFMQAGFEYIKQWFRERQNQEFQVSENLPEEVKEVVKSTLSSAQDSWWRYPSRAEADNPAGGEEMIKKYAQVSYEINNKYIWPEFKKLVDKDLEDQNMQEFMKDIEEPKGESQGLPQELKDKLSPEEQKALEEAIEKAMEETKQEQKTEKSKSGEKEKTGGGKPESESVEGKPIDLDSLSPELKQKIKDFLNSLPEDKKKELQSKAQKSLSNFEKDLNQKLEGKLSDKPEKKEGREKAEQSEDKPEEKKEVKEPKKTWHEPEELKKYRDLIEKTLKKDLNIYEKYRRELLPIIDKLEQDLREIFVARRTGKWLSGFKTGKRIDIKRRIQEKAKGISAVESKAWQKRELPSEKDYAITLLNDLSGSMQGEKIQEDFKAKIVISEVLNRLSINTEILGFNDRIYEYQKFGENMSQEIRENMGGILEEVNDFSDTGKAKWNDDGWALEQASEHLAKQRAKEKFLIVLSDGKPEESPMHSSDQYDLHKIVNKVLNETNQKLIGIGIGRDTKHVEEYYPNSIADVGVKELSEKLADLIREVIANYDKF